MELLEGGSEVVSGELSFADVVEEDLEGTSDSAQQLVVF